jgi:transcriptional regulator with XRE-family HTH domain
MTTVSAHTERLLLLVRARQLTTDDLGRRIRERHRVSANELAALLGVNKAQLSRWERGLSRPRADTAIRWLETLEALGAPPPPAQLPDLPLQRREREGPPDPFVWFLMGLAIGEAIAAELANGRRI